MRVMATVAVTLLFGHAVFGQIAPADGLVDREAAIREAHELTVERYPNSDEALVEEHIRVNYAADGTSVTWDDEYIKVLTEKGKREGRTRSFHFTLPYSTVTVMRAEIIKPDGGSVPVDVPTQSRVMVSRSQMSANIYNPNRKILQLSIPGLETGDVYHIITRRDTVKARVPDTWSDYTIFEYTVPLKHIVYEVFAPRERPLQSIVLKDQVPGTVSYVKKETADHIHHRWEVRDVPRMFTEPNMPPIHTVVQRLLVSTIPDWQTISRWYWHLCKGHLDAVTPAMRAKVLDLTQGKEDRRERIGSVFKFVSQEIRYMGITTEKEAPGYEPHDVKTTFENRYGVCRDKGALLVAMLRMADLPAYPVLIHNGSRKDEEVPQPYFNHAVVAVEEGDEQPLLMDPTDENTAELLPAYLCNKSFLVAHPVGRPLRTSPIIPATNNLVRIESRGRIDERGTLAVETSLRFEGINDNAYRGYLARIKREDRQRFFEGLVKRRVAGAKVTDWEVRPDDIRDTSESLTVRLTYEADDYLVRGRDVTMIAPPWLGTAVGYVNFVLGRTGLEKRRYPLFTEIACGVEEVFRIDLAGSVGLPILLPEYQPIRTNTVAFVQDMDVETNTLGGSSTFLLRTVEFSPAEYLGLKQMLRDIEYSWRKKPVFRSVSYKADEQDVLILNDERVVDFSDAQTCTIARSVTKKVLTYAGKKRHSELKLTYNPAWESVRIDRAVVVSPDGTTRTVSAEEVNLMDAAWVGSAPRYSAEKTMVVSLPGVEKGSVIDVVTIRELKGLPFVSLKASFRSHDPVATNVLIVSAPESLNLNILDESGEAVTYRRRDSGGRARHEWRALAEAPVRREAALPPWWSFNPTVFVSTGEWPSYAQAVRTALAAAVEGQAETRAAAAKLVAGVSEADAKVVAVRDHVAMAIRPAGPSLAKLPLSSITIADQTLREGYGNTTDRAVVLFVMLDEAGLAPEFVLASSRGPRLQSLCRPLLQCPQRDLFTDVLVRVKLGRGFVYLNDSDQYAQLGTTRHDGRPGLTMAGAGFVVSALPGREDRSEEEMHIDVSADGDAVIRSVKRVYGTEFARFHKRFAELPPEERRRHYRELLAGLSQSAEPEADLITRYDEYPGVREFAAKVPRYAVRSGEYLYLTLPGMDKPVLRLRSDTRESALYRGAPLRSVIRHRVTLPAGVTGVHLLPDDFTWEGPAGLGGLSLRQVSRADGEARVVEVTRRVDFNSAVVPPEHYQSLLEMNAKVTHPEARTVLVGLPAAE